jgi:uncharacterized protein with PIN domain
MDGGQEYRFAAEMTLGKLAKWLRILGFDTFYAPDLFGKKLINAGIKRILLTRTRRIRDMNLSKNCIFIASNDPFEQLREVIQATGITQRDLRLFTRCTRCNALIRRVQKDSIRKLVPDYVWESHDTFRMCALCRRIYWPGSHIRRSRDIIESLFI